MDSSAEASPAPAVPAADPSTVADMSTSAFSPSITTTTTTTTTPEEKPKTSNAGKEEEEGDADLTETTAATPAKLPPLSPAEFRAYNRLSEHMNLFHNHFRQTWNVLYTAASSGRRPQRMSLRAFVDEGLAFVSQLEMHHGIEESYVFPLLARKMPEFRSSSASAGEGSGGGGGKKGGGGGAAELLRQHREIHMGMAELESYLRSCRAGESDLEMATLKRKLDSWGRVLWTHLDQEVETLGAENMRRYWTLDEMRSLRI